MMDNRCALITMFIFGIASFQYFCAAEQSNKSRRKIIKPHLNCRKQEVPVINERQQSTIYLDDFVEEPIAVSAYVQKMCNAKPLIVQAEEDDFEIIMINTKGQSTNFKS